MLAERTTRCSLDLTPEFKVIRYLDAASGIPTSLYYFRNKNNSIALEKAKISCKPPRYPFRGWLKTSMVDEDVKKIAEVLKRSIPGVKIILFGSRARGTALKTSDIDLIIVSRVSSQCTLRIEQHTY